MVGWVGEKAAGRTRRRRRRPRPAAERPHRRRAGRRRGRLDDAAVGPGHQGRPGLRPRRRRHEGRPLLRTLRRQGDPRRRRPSARPPHRRQRGRRGGRRHRHAWRRILRGHTADGAVVVEPTRLRVVPAQAGSLMFRLVVHGLSAHGCVREEGVSAVEKFVPLLAALRRLEAERCGVSRRGPGGGAGRRVAPPSPATRTRRSSPATACPGRSRSARCAPATGRPASPTRWSPRGATASRSARTWPRPGGRSRRRSPAPPRPTPGWRGIRPRWSGGAGASTRPSRRVDDPVVTAVDGRRRRRHGLGAAGRGRHLRRRHAPARQRRRHPDGAVRPRRRARRAHARRVRADRRPATRRARRSSSRRCASAACAE